MSGGYGSDTFHFLIDDLTTITVLGAQGHDVIKDLSTSDTLTFHDGVSSIAELDDISTVVDKGAGKSVVATFDDGSSITMKGIGTGLLESFADLDAADYGIMFA